MSALALRRESESVYILLEQLNVRIKEVFISKIHYFARHRYMVALVA